MRKCVKRPLAEDWRWRHIRLAIKPCFLGDHTSQIKSHYGLSESVMKKCVQRPYKIYYLLMVNGRHLRLTICSDIFAVVYPCCLTPETWVYSRWNFVAIMFTSWYIRKFLSTSGHWPPFLIYDMLKYGTVSPVANMIPKTWPFIFVAIMCISWDLCKWIFKRHHLGVLTSAYL